MHKLRTIHLPPSLSELCDGDTTVELAASNFSQIVSGLSARYGIEVRKFIAPNWWMVKFDDEYVDQENVHNLGETENIYISPMVEGAGTRTVMGILGVAMIIVGIALAFPTGGASLTVMAQGLTMAAGGAMMIYTALTMPNGPQARSEADERASFVYNGTVNILEQGSAVPLWYGLFEGGTVVASAGIYTEQLAVYNTPPGSNPAPDGAFELVAWIMTQ